MYCFSGGQEGFEKWWLSILKAFCQGNILSSSYNTLIWWCVDIMIKYDDDGKRGRKKKRMGKGFISGATSMLEHMCYFFHLQKNCLCNFWIKQNFCTDIFSNSFD